jgi:excisionase family DNA binding protein
MVTEPDLKLHEVAEALRVSPETVRRWLVSGHIKGYRPGGTKAGWRIPASELQRLREGGSDGQPG